MNPHTFHRLSYPVVMLLLLLQRTPVVQTILSAAPRPPAFIGQLLRAAMTAVTTAGAVHSLTGATTFSTNPSSPASGTVGQGFSLAWSITGTPTSAQSYRITGSPPPGLSVPGLVGGILNSGIGTVQGTPTQAGTFSFFVQGWNGPNATGFTNNVQYQILFSISGSATSPPAISQQPRALMLPTGYAGSFSLTATGTPAPTFQWRKNGVNIPGATQSALPFTLAQPSDAGAYSVVVTNSQGTVTSASATLTVGSGNGRFKNLSTRGFVRTGGEIMISGAIIGGSTPKQLLIRTIGPTLADFGVTGALADPTLRVFQGQTVIFSNDDWATGNNVAQIQSVFSQVGAFPLTVGSKDSVVLATFAPGAYTFQAIGKNDTTGIALMELYEPTQDGRLLNISTRGFVGIESAGTLMIPGTVFDAPTPKTLLIRAVGPSLTQFGVDGVLADPVLKIVNSAGQDILFADDWGTEANLQAIQEVSAKVGAFSLVNGSKDAVLLAVLPQGLYTFLITGKNNSTGVAIVEVYEVPDGP